MLFNNEVELSWFNPVLLIKLTNVEFNILKAVVFWIEFILLLIFIIDIVVVVLVVFPDEPKLIEVNKLVELIVLFETNGKPIPSAVRFIYGWVLLLFI